MNIILNKVNKAGIVFLETFDLNDTYKKIIVQANNIFDSDFGSIFVEENGKLRRVYSTVPAKLRTKPKINGYAYKSLNEKESFIIQADRFKNYLPKFYKAKISSIIFIPLINQKQSMGVLIIHSKKKQRVSKKKSETLKLYGFIASVAIKKAQLFNDATVALQTRDQFISTAAHELRTPLTAINGYAQLISRKFSKNGNSQGRWARELSKESMRLTYMINELLEVSRIQSGRMRMIFKEYDIYKIIQSATKNFELNFPQRKVNLIKKVKEGEDKIIGDNAKLEEVIFNVLENAARYSSSKSKIEIYVERSSSYLLIKIKDYGKGIRKKDIPLILNGLYRNSNNEGMGIGLFIAKNILLAHHGLIKISSKINVGTTVQIRLLKA